MKKSILFLLFILTFNSGSSAQNLHLPDWIKGTSSSIESFIKIFNKSVWPVNTLEDSKLFISSVSESIKDSSNILSLGKYDIYPKSDWIKSTTLSIKSFENFSALAYIIFICGFLFVSSLPIACKIWVFPSPTPP